MNEGSRPRFQWDEEKNRVNVEKHGIDFRDAVSVFERQTFDRLDARRDSGETRINSLGEMGRQVVVNVTHTNRNGEIRLISARPATSRERERYREFQRDLEAERERQQPERSQRATPSSG